MHNAQSVEARGTAMVAMSPRRPAKPVESQLALLKRLEETGIPANADNASLIVIERAKDAVVQHALRIMESRLKYHDLVLSAPVMVRDYLRLRLATQEWEIFVVLFL